MGETCGDGSSGCGPLSGADADGTMKPLPPAVCLHSLGSVMPLAPHTYATVMGQVHPEVGGGAAASRVLGLSAAVGRWQEVVATENL